MSEFDELVADFDALVASSAGLSGKDLTANRREQTRIEKLVAALAETGLHGYNSDYAECRDIGHVWEVKFAEWETNELTRLHVCDRCGSERLDAISRTGALRSRRYTYSEGFLLDADDDLASMGAGTRHRRYWRAVNVQKAIAT